MFLELETIRYYELSATELPPNARSRSTARHTVRSLTPVAETGGMRALGRQRLGTATTAQQSGRSSRWRSFEGGK